MIYQVLEEEINPNEIEIGPQTLQEFVAEMKSELPDAKTFAIKLKSMVYSLVSFHYKQLMLESNVK